ncbi:alpha/beta-hydrolase [Serendipita vermifera]|nr:alpha/beta-hydrolase [Serendipita vermifera]
MRFSLLPFFTLWFPVLTSCSTQNVPTIQTTSGKLQGVSASNNTNAYLGIPFALPPVGQLRFLAPRPLVTPNIVRNATSLGPACIQLPAASFSTSSTGQSEDCLTINVWTSRTSPGQAGIPKKGKPVFIWIYGGGWNTGFTSEPLYNLANFVNAHPEIIAVSFNYRLNIFGYVHSPAISGPETNAGLRDQRLAIEWVHKNIAAFGGDPNRLTLGGESAGSSSTSGYLYAYPKDSLISGAIMMSGQAIFMGGSLPFDILGGPQRGPDPFPIVANATGCPLEGNDAAAQIECLRGKSTQQLVDVLRDQNILGITPYADNQTVFLTETYRSRGSLGKFAKVPVLLGTTNNEGDLFSYTSATSINETLSDQITAILFTCPESQQATYFLSAGVPAYRYRYMPVFPSVSQPPLRAFHASDLPILFDHVEDGMLTHISPTDVEIAATKYMQKAWAAFITNPTSGLKSLGWPLYKGTNGGKTLVELFPDNTVQSPILLETPTKFETLCSV